MSEKQKSTVDSEKPPQGKKTNYKPESNKFSLIFYRSLFVEILANLTDPSTSSETVADSSDTNGQTTGVPKSQMAVISTSWAEEMEISDKNPKASVTEQNSCQEAKNENVPSMAVSSSKASAR